VHDVVPALVALLSDESAYGKVFNLGSTEQTTISQLAERVITKTDSESVIAKVPYEEAYGEGYEDMQRRIPDCNRAYNQIGFVPTRTLDDIIDAVVADRRP
jgi:UDP-glucose 4-epimerase